MLDIQKDKETKILQSNALVRSRQTFSMMQRRLFYLAMKAVARSDVDFRELIIPEPYLRGLMSANYGSFKEKLYDAASGLTGTTITIHRPSGSWAHISVFQTIEYLSAGEESETGFKNTNRYPVVRMKLHEDLKTYLLKLDKGYNSQPFLYVLAFRNPRAHKLFELLLHGSWAGEKPLVPFSRDDLEAYLDLDKKGYKKFRDLRRVLDRLQSEIEEITPMRLCYEGKRLGRAVGQLDFKVDMSGKVRQPRLGEVEDSDEEIETLQLANELRELEFKQDPFKLIERHGREAVRQAVQMTRAAIRQNEGTKNPIHNPGGFVTFLLKHEVSLEHETTEAEIDGAKLKALTLELRERYDALLMHYCEEAYTVLGPEDREHLDNLMRATLSKFELQQLELAKWQGTIYVGCRNRVMLNNKVVALPGSLATVAGFLAGETLEATGAEVRALTVGLAEELQLPVGA
jgi:hypothetical protein